MNNTPTSTDDGPAAELYEIRLRGHLQARWAAWFDGMQLSQDRDGTSVIQALVADQAALYGLIQKVRDLGLPLVSITQADSGHTTRPETTTDHEQSNKETHA